MSTSRTTTETTNTVGSIPITGGTDPRPLAPTRPITPSASNEEWELERQMERNRERLQKLKEKRKAKEVAKKKAEEKQREEVAARGHERQEKKGKGHLRPEAVGGNPDDGDDGDDDDDAEDERAPCQSTMLVLRPASYGEAGRWSTTDWRAPGGVGKSKMAQLLTDNQQFREGQVKKIPPPEMPKTRPTELPRKRKRVVDSDEEEEGIEREETKDGEEEEQEQEKDQGGEEEEEEEEEPVPKKARSVKGKERAVE
ncbi:hypothetical protein EV359DRAFT_86926 [Lentinula novae-zelandiae]|nr:hypothetical protein EV359DRAFT_86926 [Lentinula novae-zelandiae]